MTRGLVAIIAICLLCLSFGGVATQEETRVANGYEMRLIYSPPLAGLGKIVLSEFGGVYILHCPEPGAHRVSKVNLDGEMVPVHGLGPEGTLVGGPADTFFVSDGQSIIQVGPDGQTSRWGDRPQAQPQWYTSGGTFLAFTTDAVIEVYDDGTYETLLDGLAKEPYDVVEHEGRVFVFVMDGSLIRLDPDGGSTLLASLPADNTHLFPHDDMLYLNGGGNRLVTVDQESGEISHVVEPRYFRSIHTPANFVISDRVAIFASFVSCTLTWVDLDTGEGGELIEQHWSNGPADVGPDGAIYLAVEHVGERSEIVRYFADGGGEVYVGDIQGRLVDLSFNPNGDLFFALASDQRRVIISKPWGESGYVEVPDSDGLWTTSLSVDPVTGHALASLENGGEGPLTIVEFSESGLHEIHDVSLPVSPTSIKLDHGPDGELYLAVVDREAFYAGPEVERWIIQLDLESGGGSILFQRDLMGVCPMIAFSVDHTGHMWWILNPDFVLYRVSAEGEGLLFAENLPVDSGAAVMNTAGHLFLNTPEGLYLIERQESGGISTALIIVMVTAIALVAMIIALRMRRS